jgi:hypothetical protein
MASVTELLAPPLDNAQASPALLNHPTQSVAPINGWSSVLFGLPFLAAGIAIELTAANKIHASKHVPDWLIGVIGAMFGLAGLFLSVHGVVDLARKSAYRREAAQRPHEVCLYDFHWRSE